jgi:cytochrome c oxidase assembly factor CtaG
MTTEQLFFASWDFELPFIIGCGGMWLAYLYAVRFRFDFRTINFTLGLLIVFLAFVSPVDKLGEDYLFSAHMLQHMMLGLFAPPLLVAGLPQSLVSAVLKLPLMARAERILGHPILTLIVGVGTFWIWHLPRLYDLALDNDFVHAVEHMSFLITGCMLWWPVFKPIEASRLKPLWAIVYLAAAMIPGTVLGIIFTLADTPYYSTYAHPKDELGALTLIREGWGLSQLEDQKLGGAIMWEPMGAIFLWAMMMKMVAWFKESDESSAGNVEREANDVRTE